MIKSDVQHLALAEALYEIWRSHLSEPSQLAAWANADRTEQQAFMAVALFANKEREDWEAAHRRLEDQYIAAMDEKRILDAKVKMLRRQLESSINDNAETELTVSAVIDAPSMTPEQNAVFARCFKMGCGELQARVLRGDEDDQLKALLDMYEAYFALCRSKLGHDHVPIATWETYMMIKRRDAQVPRVSSTVREP